MRPSRARRFGGGPRRTVLFSFALAALASGCSVPRHVHDPLDFPDERINAFHLELLVHQAVLRSPPGSATWGLPEDYAEIASVRLASLVTGEGPVLLVTVTSANVGVTEIVDARGEMTRVSVALDLEVSVQGGPVLRRASAESRSDIPRGEATHEEIEFVLRATSINALERYFAMPRTPRALNADLAAYLAAHPGVRLP